MYYKRSLVLFTVILFAMLYDTPKAFANTELHTGIGAELYFTGYVPFGGGAGLTARFKKVPFVLTVAGAYLNGRHGVIKGTFDYWFLSEKIADIKSSASFHWFAGIGMLADTIFYSVPIPSGKGYNTMVGGGVGLRMPIGCYFYAGQEKYEPYLQVCPEFGFSVYPKGFSKRISALWAFPVSFGCRFWF